MNPIKKVIGSTLPNSLFSALGLCYFTDILHGAEGTISKIPRKEGTFLITYPDSSKNVLRTFCFAEDDAHSIAYQKAVYDSLDKLGAATKHIPRPLRMATTKLSGTLYVEELHEWVGDSLLAKGPPGPDLLLEWARQTLAGQVAGVKVGVHHTGIRPGTLGWFNGILKIGDIIPEPELQNTHSMLQTTFSDFLKAEKFCYFPPELLSGETATKSYDKQKVDVYGWGMHFYRLLTGKGVMQLWGECQKFKSTSKADYAPFVKEVDAVKTKGGVLREKLGPFVKKALEYSPEERPTFEELAEGVAKISLE